MEPLRQYLYVSSSRPAGTPADLASILDVSRRNNAIDGVTGLLYTDGTRFLQVIEGSKDAIDAAVGRIAKDPRHAGMVKLADREIEAREFGSWDMAERRPDRVPDDFDDRLARMLEHAAPQIRETFLGLIATRDAQAAARRV